MKRRIPLGIVIALVIIVAGASVGITSVTLNRMYNSVVADFSKRSQEYKYLGDVDTIVRNNYYGTVDDDSINIGSANGYVEGLNDDGCMFLTAEEYAGYKTFLAGKLSGTGIYAAYSEENNCLTVSSVTKDSPAETVGIKQGCMILSVNGKDVTSANSEGLISKLSETQDGEFVLSCMYPDDEKPSEKTVSCGYSVTSVFSSVTSSVGYVRITAFYENTAELFADALNEFSEKSVTGIVIDLRNNSSVTGYDSAAKIIDYIVPVATTGNMAIAVEKNKAGETTKVYSSDSDSISTPIAVLVNDRTSGPAELIATDLRQFGKASVYGEKTVGNAEVTSVFELSDGNALVLVTGIICPYKGVTYNGTGIEPDVVIEMSTVEKNTLDTIAGKDTDAVYSEAVKNLKG